MTTGSSHAGGGALREQQMARLPHTYPLCRCGEDHHSEAFSAGWKARGEADAARADAQPRLVAALVDIEDRLRLRDDGSTPTGETVAQAWLTAIRAFAATPEASAGAVERVCTYWQGTDHAPCPFGRTDHGYADSPAGHWWQPGPPTRCAAHGQDHSNGCEGESYVIPIDCGDERYEQGDGR